MGKIIAPVTMSLDGYIAGAAVSLEHPLGVGGERLHEWLFADAPSPIDEEITANLRAGIGAVVVGRRTFDVGHAQWGDTPYPVPTFVLTHEERPSLAQRSGEFHFVAGVLEAVAAARAAAGTSDVVLMGADVTQQCLAAGLVNELRVQIAPVLFGAGTRLFGELAGPIELTPLSVTQSPYVTHLHFCVPAAG